MLLHSFGIGYGPANQLEPGNYVIHKFAQKYYPLDVHGSQKKFKNEEDNVHDVHDLFPLAHPPHDNLEVGRKVKIGHYQKQWKIWNESAATSFIAQADHEGDNVDQDSILGKIDDESLCGVYDEFFVTDLQALVLEDWQGGKISKSTIKKLKDHQPVSLKVLGFSQGSDLCVQSILDQEMISSPNKYSQESVWMLNRPGPIESFLGSQSSDSISFTKDILPELDYNEKKEKYHFDRITDHQGPLTRAKNPDTYKNCKYNVSVKWTNGTTTWEPLNRFVDDSPLGVAKYIFDNGVQHLLQEELWGRKLVKEEVDRLANLVEKDVFEKVNDGVSSENLKKGSKINGCANKGEQRKSKRKPSNNSSYRNNNKKRLAKDKKKVKIKEKNNGKNQPLVCKYNIVYSSFFKMLAFTRIGKNLLNPQKLFCKHNIVYNSFSKCGPLRIMAKIY